MEKTSSDTTVNEGEDATLVCHASGRPLPTIIWRREDGKPFHVKPAKKLGKKKIQMPASIMPLGVLTFETLSSD